MGPKIGVPYISSGKNMKSYKNFHFLLIGLLFAIKTFVFCKKNDKYLSEVKRKSQ